MVGIVVAVIAVLGAGWYFLVRDDSDSPTTSSTSSSRSSTTSTTAAGDSTTSSTAAGGSSTSSTVPDADPQSYAVALFNAWAAGDQASAASVADQTAIDSLFASPSSEASAYSFSGCQGAAGSIYCTWTRPGGQIAMQVRDATGGLPVQVIGVTIGPG